MGLLETSDSSLGRMVLRLRSLTVKECELPHCLYDTLGESPSTHELSFVNSKIVPQVLFFARRVRESASFLARRFPRFKRPNSRCIDTRLL